jgi:hypothetical protein
MGLRVQHPLIKADEIRLREKQVVVLERLGEPEALHFVAQARLLLHHIVDRTVGDLGTSGLDRGLEHTPAFVHPRGVASDAVHVPHRLDGFGSMTAAR